VAVANGVGIGMAPLWQVRELLDQGKVELVLQDFEPPRLPVMVVSPAGKTTPPKTRLFTDLLSAHLRNARHL
jgi:DNA-binding transcriptional LysR family regulator